jgi:hypothetical protein
MGQSADKAVLAAIRRSAEHKWSNRRRPRGARRILYQGQGHSINHCSYTSHTGQTSPAGLTSCRWIRPDWIPLDHIIITRSKEITKNQATLYTPIIWTPPYLARCDRKSFPKNPHDVVL